MAPPSPDSSSSVRPLPRDALYEVLLRVPARDLCRLRAVCRPWRSLLSDPRFIADHAALHPEPLIVAGYLPGCSAAGHLLDIMDLSGHVIKRVVEPGNWALKMVMTAQLDDFCILTGDDMVCLLLNTATGAVSGLPRGFHKHSVQEPDRCYMQLVAIGKVASTGQYKVVRVIQRILDREQLCEVFTLDGSSRVQRRREEWRGKKASPDFVDFRQWSRVTINGIVYFLSLEIVVGQDGIPLRLASFDLETEEWRAILRGPLDLLDIDLPNISVASLNGCLVVVGIRCSSVDLWFLTDFEKGLWVKQHSIQLKLSFHYNNPSVCPLLVLDDGRILIYNGDKVMRIYDPNTCTNTDVAEIGHRYEIGLYTGNLLSLPDGAGAQLMR